LREFYYELDMIDRCIAISNRTLQEDGPDSSAYYYIGACHEILKEDKKALEYYQKALPLDPNNSIIQAGLARMTT